MTTMPSYVATTNACKLCKPLGASLAFKGIEGCVPFLHGSQGCATYMRRYIISHFNEPIDIASSSLGEKHAVYGGGPNLIAGLNNVITAYRPQLIGVATTCLTETIGDNVPMILRQYREQFGTNDLPELVHVSTPSYGGTHMEGFHAAVRAVVQQLVQPAAPHDRVNLFCGMVSPADIRYLRELTTSFGLGATILPDYSDTLDGTILDSYPLLPEGGTPLNEIRTMSGARCSLEMGATLPDETAGSVLQDRFQVPLRRIGLPIGIRATDALIECLGDVSGHAVPRRYESVRGRLVDALVDGHKYVSGKRAAVYGEEDLVVGLTSFLAEIGIHPVICASGGKSGRLQSAIDRVLHDITCPAPSVREDVDFYDIENLVHDAGVDLVIGHSKGYAFCRREQIPLIRVGFPIHDRVGGQRILHVGYDGALALFDTIANTLIEQKQDASPVGYSYM